MVGFTKYWLTKGLLVPLLVFVLLGLGCGDDDPETGPNASAKPRVLIVHSYDNGFRWSADQDEGIRKGLADGGYEEDEIDLRVIYMDTRVNFITEEQIALRAGIARRTIDEFDPELVILTDDTAVEEVAVPFLLEHPDSTISFVFSGVNGQPERYQPVRDLAAPGARLTGTVERIPFLEGFTEAERVFGMLETIVVFADDAPASRIVVDNFRSSLLSGGVTYPTRVVDVIQISTFEEWKQKVAEYRGQVDAIAVVNYHRVKDPSGNIVQPKDVAKWTIENARVPVFGLISDWSADGYVMSFGNSGFDAGVFVGRRGADVLAGQDAGAMPIVDPEQYEITFNQTTIDKLEVSIPQSELDKASEIFE